ncbi:uncharacterized protein LOC126904613 isoform X1 [Daktulosphaira vitifoliae]|uniref:uncharacterized protein LOC126904613 isoform X1 n=1 Tax=Daktulosphaira vitifoliae TaxID=58002 RepID=UPI0021A97FFA|nr:uncharacterized protein LOC126904613 isoform X1 [Daktulosphaira vitifoliae]XP_050539736.1 uncharacterized protein LOC126904613 isoform X1 [Daktulosphaira vitifoliae]
MKLIALKSFYIIVTIYETTNANREALDKTRHNFKNAQRKLIDCLDRNHYGAPLKDWSGYVMRVVSNRLNGLRVDIVLGLKNENVVDTDIATFVCNLGIDATDKMSKYVEHCNNVTRICSQIFRQTLHEKIDSRSWGAKLFGKKTNNS